MISGFTLWNMMNGEEGYNEINRRARSKLYVLGVNDPSEVRDYIHDALIYVQKHLGNYDFDSFDHLINAVVWKACMLRRDELRRINKHVSPIEALNGNEIDEEVAIYHFNSDSHELYDVTDPAIIYDQEVSMCDERDAIQKALKRMSPRERKAYSYFLKGYSREEIAHEMKTTKAAVTKLLQRGAKK